MPQTVSTTATWMYQCQTVFRLENNSLAVACYLALDPRTQWLGTQEAYFWVLRPEPDVWCTCSTIQHQMAGHRQTVFFKSKNSLAVVYPGGSSGYSLRHSILFEVLLWPMRSLALATASVTWLLPLQLQTRCFAALTQASWLWPEKPQKTPFVKLIEVETV